MSKVNQLMGGASVAAIAALFSAEAAHAQAPSGAPPAEAAVEEVVVTGSRIVGTFTAPTPVTAVTSEQLQVTAVTTIAQGLQQLPAVNPGGGPTAGGGTGNGGQNFLSLRGLGAGRTLTLVDGRRFTPSGPAGNVDSNLIPSGLVQRVDVVTGGASAAYGSDAVGGVINFILDKRFEGFEVDAHYGQSEHDDNKDYRATINFGTPFAGGRGHLIASAEYYENKGVRGDQREFRRTAANEVLDPTRTNSYVRIDDIRTPFTRGGLVVNGAGGAAANNAQIRGLMFDPSGRAVPYDYGTVSTTVGSTAGTQNGGDGFRVSTGQEIIRPLERKTIFLHGEYEVTPAVNFFAEASYAATNSTFESSPTTHTLTIQRDNAYLARQAPEIVARMTQLGVPRFSLNRLTLEKGPTYTRNDNYTLRGLFGFNGEVKGWNWEVAYQDGQNRNDSPVFNNLYTARMALAADAVVNPANGQIVCRSTLTDPGNGCAPFNPFGEGAPSTAALDYVLGYVPTSLTKTRQRAANFNLSGELFTLPAGPLAVAVGGEWRKITASTRADALSNAGAFRLVNQQDFFGAYSIREVYAEAQIPVLRDVRFFQNFDLNVAGRHTDYSTSGGVNTWKAGVNWQVYSDLRFRATRSRDIRAPNLSELFATGRQNNVTIDDPVTGRNFIGVPNNTFGNPDLKPEKADTLVAGFVYQPSYLPGFSFAFDYWDIEIKDAIANVGGGNAVLECYRSNNTSPICAFVVRDPVTQNILRTRTSPANLTVTKASGYDVEASYRVPLADMFTSFDPGTLSIRTVIGFRAKNITISPLVALPINTAGQQGNPHYRATVSANWQRKAVRVALVGRYIGEQIWDKQRTLGVDTDFQDISAAFYLDGRFGWEFRPNKELYVNVQNILDKDPVYSPNPGGATPTPTDTALYDQVGRNWTVGVRLRF